MAARTCSVVDTSPVVLRSVAVAVVVAGIGADVGVVDPVVGYKPKADIPSSIAKLDGYDRPTVRFTWQ